MLKATVAVAGAASIVTLWCYGGPPLHHPDDITGFALRVADNWGNPKFFNYPAFVFYVYALGYGAAYVMLRSTGALSNSDDFAEAYHRGVLPVGEDGIHFAWPAVVCNIVFAAGALWLLMRWTREVTRSTFAAGISVVALATFPLWRSEVVMPTVDCIAASLAFMAAATAWTGVPAPHASPALAPRSARPHWGGRRVLGIPVGLVLAAVLCGVAAAAKYPAALVTVTVCGAPLFDEELPPLNRLMNGLIVGVIALVSFLLCAPYTLIEFELFLKQFISMAQFAKLGHASGTSASGFALVEHVTESLPRGVGIPCMVLALAGVVGIYRTRELSAGQKWTLLSMPALYSVQMAFSKMVFARYMLVLLPFLALYLGVAWSWASARLEGWLRDCGFDATRGGLACSGSVLVVAGPIALNAHEAWAIGHIASKGDTRQAARELLQSLAMDRQVRDVYLTGHVLPGHRRRPLEAMGLHFVDDPADADLLLLDSFALDRFIRRHPRPGGPTDHQYLATDGQPWDTLRLTSGWYAFELTPFLVPPDQVADSPKSSYGPYPPDLRQRRSAGPYLEVLATAPAVAHEVGRFCDSSSLCWRRVESHFVASASGTTGTGTGT